MATGTKGSLLELKKQLESVYPIIASVIGAGSAKSIKAMNRRKRWERGYCTNTTLDMLTPRRESGAWRWEHSTNPIVDGVKDENPVQFDPEQVSKHRSHVASCLFFSQDRADNTFAVNELCQKMSDPTQHSFAKLKRLVRYLKGEKQWSAGVALVGRNFLKAYTRKQKINALSSVES